MARDWRSPGRWAWSAVGSSGRKVAVLHVANFVRLHLVLDDMAQRVVMLGFVLVGVWRQR